ncbi:MAG TPA: helix-turn-helix domain-containing protein [Terriglobia bacterium]|nr:helix-turn-helix domain-containing protein [Terriglobia bacterium]
MHFEEARHFCGKSAEPFGIELRTGADGVGQWLTGDLAASQYEQAALLFAEGCDIPAVMEELGVSRAQAYRYQKQFRKSQSHDLTP